MSGRFGKRSLSIGSGVDCDIRLGGPGVAAHHASVTREERRGLVIIAREGATRWGEETLEPGESRDFDFKTPIVLGDATPIPTSHPDFARLLAEPGKAARPPNQASIGRDRSRVNLAIAHPNVSGEHALLELKPLTITDSGSTSGTWVEKRRLPPGEPQALTPTSLVELGPIPFTGRALQELAQEALTDAPAADSLANNATRASSARAPRKAHATIVGQLSLEASGEQHQLVGRRPECDITIAHPQVSGRHAILHQSGGQLFIEDCGSANGTLVRGKRIAKGQRVAVSAGEKVFIGPMPLRIQAEASQAALVIDDTSNWEGRPLYEIEAWDLAIEVTDRDNPGQKKLLLDHVSFKALPGDFIALMGPSGAGKTTLLLALNGYLPPHLRASPHQRGEPLQHLRCPARVHRLRSPG